MSRFEPKMEIDLSIDSMVIFLNKKREANMASKKTIATLYNFHFKKIKEELIPLLDKFPIKSIFQYLIEENLIPNWFKYGSFYSRIRNLKASLKNQIHTRQNNNSINSRDIPTIAKNYVKEKFNTQKESSTIINVAKSNSSNSHCNAIEYLDDFPVVANLREKVNEWFKDIPNWMPVLDPLEESEVLNVDDSRFPFKDTLFRWKDRFLVKNGFIFDKTLTMTINNKDYYMPIVKDWIPMDDHYVCKNKEGNKEAIDFWKVEHLIADFINHNPNKRLNFLKILE